MSFLSVLGTASVIVLAVSGVAPSAGCDALKHNDADAAAVAPVVVPAVPATTAAPATQAPPVTTVAPLGGAAPTPAGGAKLDGGKAVAADGGAATDGGAAGDAGKAAPAPTPTFTIPTAIPGFDAGAFKPPPGFPSTIPTFPQPPPAPTPTPGR